MSKVIDQAYEGIAVVDKDGYIIYFNETYCRIKGIKKEDAIKRHCTEVIENTRLHIVLQTGVPERGKLQTIAGQEMIVHRIPIWENNKVIAAIGMLVFEGVSELHEILQRIENERKQGVANNDTLSMKQNESAYFGFEKIIGKSEAIVETKRLARRSAKTLATVLITGESGTGKELFAKAIHSASPYHKGKILSINCAAIPEHLLEAELFGYDEGAFTGAKKGGKPGMFELANNGTLFLDEIGDMPLLTQSKILRVLQEKEVVRVGGVKAYPINTRFIAATNKDLLEMVKQRQFREDLYYRLNIIPIRLPPLRERKGDIPLLLSHLVEEVVRRNRLEPKQFTAQTLTRFIQYDWPGNVREMMNVVEQLISLVEGRSVTPEDLPSEFAYLDDAIITKSKVSYMHKFQSIQSEQDNLENDHDLILQVLREEKGNKTKAAKRLGIHRSTLYEKLKKINLVD
nr:sigma 54-interacting transcriptional regulator [Bacillus sp. FJAT-50079]